MNIGKTLRKERPRLIKLPYRNVMCVFSAETHFLAFSTKTIELRCAVLKLQRRAARIILYANRLAPSVTLFYKLGWIPFHEQSKIKKCAIFYKRVNGSLLMNTTINNTQHYRSTQYAGYNSICPYYKRETERGRSFAVLAT